MYERSPLRLSRAPLGRPERLIDMLAELVYEWIKTNEAKKAWHQFTGDEIGICMDFANWLESRLPNTACTRQGVGLAREDDLGVTPCG